MISDIKKYAREASAGIDMSVASKGGAKYLLPEGMALGRMVEYIEFGKQPQEYQGQPKDPMMEVQIGFALYGEGYQKEDGSPRMISTFPMKLSNNERATAFKLFKRMNAKGTAKHFADFLGEPFLVPIVHKKTGTGAYARIDMEQIQYGMDPITRKPYNVPQPAESQYRVFLWNHPTKEMWDSIHIDSKNFLQEKCLSATDYPGSRLEAMLKGELPSLTQEAPEIPYDDAPEYEDVPF